MQSDYCYMLFALISMLTILISTSYLLLKELLKMFMLHKTLVAILHKWPGISQTTGALPQISISFGALHLFTILTNA